MNARNRFRNCGWLIIPALLLAACTPPTPSNPVTLPPVSEATTTSQPTSTQTPLPTLTPTAMPSLTPTVTPTNTPTMIPAIEGGGGWIAFQEETEAGISVMDADGKRRAALTSIVSSMNPDNQELDFLANIWDGSGPDWSPDSKKIAFSAENDIYVMDADGSNLARLTNDMERNEDPSWSPDGKRIAFVSVRDGEQRVYVMDADGSNQKLLIDEPSKSPDWSPDGSQIVYSAVLDKKVVLKIANADGTGAREVLNNSYKQDEAAWSPDGKRIAFIETISLSTLMVMNPDGTNVVKIAGPRYDPHGPAWSPDGRWLAFFCLSCKKPGIFKVEADGENNPILLIEGGSVEHLAWGNPNGAIYPQMVKAYDQWLLDLLPTSEIAKEAFGQEKPSQIKFLHPVRARQGDWVLVDLDTSFLSVPAGWADSSYGYEMISFDPNGELGDSDAAVLYFPSKLDNQESLSEALRLAVNLDPRTNSKIVEVDKNKAYSISLYKTGGQRIIVLAYATMLGNDDNSYGILVASAKEALWSLYYPVFREMISHWYSSSFELLGSELPVKLRP